jgi:hypothetical protein
MEVQHHEGRAKDTLYLFPALVIKALGRECSSPTNVALGLTANFAGWRIVVLATKRRPSAIDFGLSNQTRAYQVSNARIGETVTMTTHAVFQTSSFKAPLVAKSAVVVCAMSRIAMPSVGCAKSTDEQPKRHE